jgi:hypothetical protein
MKKITLIFAWLTLSLTVFAQAPSNDNCSGATSLGTLPTPTACSKGSGGDGAVVTLNTTNVNATAGNPYVSILDCGTGTADQANPALDVWYSFVATGNAVTINITNITGSITTPHIGFWGGNCTNLVALGCNIGATATFEPITPGQTYYFQISGANNTQSGNFTLNVDNNNSCNDCNTESILTVSPLPVNGTYAVGQEVTFCYQVLTYNEVSSNWLHGVQINFGAGWDTSFGTSGVSNPTITPTSCSGSGTWGFYPTGIGTVNGTAWGMGFYYDYNSGPAGPQNNYGDFRASNCDLEFCFTLRADPLSLCNPSSPSSLNVTINTSADGESGSWTSVACQGDPATNFDAILACCSAPTMQSTQTTCFGGSDGSATATVTNTISPWDYQWYDSLGNLIQDTQNSASTTNTATGLTAGTYTVVVTDNSGCVSSNVVVVTSAPGSTVTVPGNQTVCVNDVISAANFVISPSGGTITWTNSNPDIGLAASGSGNIASFTALNPTSGVISANITVTPISSGGCAGQPSIYTIIVNPAPLINIASSQTICANQTVNLSGAYSPLPATTQLTFSSTAPAVINTSGQSGTGVISTTITGVQPTTLYSGQIVSACFTLKHKNTDELRNLRLIINGVTYTSANPAPGGEVHSPELATILADIRLPANNGLSITYCLSSTFLNAITGNTNSTWTLTITDITNAGGNGGDILDFTVVMLNTPVFTYAWSPTGTLSGGTFSGNTSTSPLAINATPATTTTYTLSITDSQSGCTGVGTVTLTVAKIDPTFTQLGPYCVGDTPGTLPTTSTNGVAGTWNAAISTAAAGTITYTFTPSDLNCFNMVTMDVVVNSPTLVPTFTQLGPYCINDTPGTLPTISNNAITGTWNAAISTASAGTVTYTFSPVAGSCATQATMDVTVAAPTVPTFTQLGPYCQNAVPGTLPTTSDNGITGTWNTAISTSSAGTVTYTFTPTAGLCATQATMDVTITPLDNAGFTYSIGTFCVTGSDPSPTITGLTGGTFSAPGVSINPSTGLIDLDATGIGGPFTVTYTTNGTCPNSSTFQISVVDSPSAEFTYNSPFCQADPQLTESPAFVGAASGGVFSSTPGGLSLNTSTGVVTFATSTPGIYDVTNTIAASGGCAAAVHTTQMEVLLTPTVNDPSDQELCAGVGTTLVTFSGNSGSTTYNWTNDNTSIGLAASGNTNIASFTAINTGTTNQVATITVTPTLNGCDGTPQTFTITVKPIPTVNAVSNQELCLGEATTDITFVGNIGTSTYNWTSSGDNIGLAASGSGDITSFTPTASGTATITVIPTVDGCDGTPQVFTITVNPIPDASFTLQSSICLTGGAITLTPNQSGGTFSGTGVSGTTFDPAVAGIGGPYTITYDISVNGCVNQSTEQITVTALDDASFTFADYCAGSTNGPANIVTAGGTFSFDPAPGDGATINPTTGVITGGVAGTTYSVVYTTTGNCSATTFPAVPVTVLALPTATITGGTNICAGDALPTLSISFTGAADWTYTLNGVQATTSNNPEVITPTTGGTYTVTTVTDANCTNSGNSSSTTINITTPVASFIATPETGATPLEVVFTNTGSGDTFSWDFETDGTVDATTENTSNTYVNLGTYTVTLTITENGCPATTSMEITVVGGSSVEIPNGFSPDGQGLNELFKARSENLVSESFQIFNRWGQLLYEGPAWMEHITDNQLLKEHTTMCLRA